MHNRNKGVDLFRLVAALMVIAIHTFPFQSIDPFIDDAITLTAFRIAVPFFFMTTGYFLLGKLSLKLNYNTIEKTKEYIYKIGRIYVYSILLYLPLSILNGTVTLKMNVLSILKLLLFDGTFYHLWYFPASIIGILLVLGLLKYTNLKVTISISVLLYLIGVGGDSWYGITSQAPYLDKMYGFIFNLMSYTRSGIFFTPLFLCLGIVLYRNQQILKKLKKITLIFSALFIGLMIEGISLHIFTTMRHDSMYLLLPPVMVFLFILLLNWEPNVKLKNIAELVLLVYVTHPLLIVVVHYLSNYFTPFKNSILNYILVTMGSFLLSYTLQSLKGKVKVKKNMDYPSRASKMISSLAIQHNITEIEKIIPKSTKIMGVVKANAYGCGMVEVARELEKNGINFFCVATIDEAISLRKSNIRGDILILGYTHPKRINEILKYDLIQSIVSENHAKMLNRKRTSIRCHLQVDTGMHRLGVDADLERIQAIYLLPHLKIEGIYSHLGSADSLEGAAVYRTEKQIDMFTMILQGLNRMGISYGFTHIQSSYGVLNYPELEFDFVRVGLLLYGFLSEGDVPTRSDISLRPIVKVKASLVLERVVEAGEYIGYGLDVQLKKRTKIGVISIGYADGVPRSLSNKGFRLEFKGQHIQQIGNICMDMLTVDLSGIKDISINDEVTVLSDMEIIANETGTITNEILSGLSLRLDTILEK